MQRNKGRPVRKYVNRDGCRFCKAVLAGKLKLDWQEHESLMELLSPRGRILARNFTGTCVKHQRRVTKVVKQARHLGLLPFVVNE